MSAPALAQSRPPLGLGLVLVGLLGLAWGCNWPIMKLTLAEVDVWTFRAVSCTVGERLYVGKELDQRAKVERVRGRVKYEDMTHAAQSELPFVVEQIVKQEEARFIQFYNDAGPVTTRMHVLELLPGLGKKLMMAVIEEKRRGGPFKSFEDLDTRVKALHAPAKLIAHRIELEIKDPNQKYHLFALPMRKEDEDDWGHRGHGHGPPARR